MFPKRLCGVLAVVLCLATQAAAAPLAHGWSQRFGDGNSQFAYGVATDASGAVVLTGSIWGTVNFGGGVLTSAGVEDAYIARFDAAGSHLWSKRFGDTLTQIARSVAVDYNGNVVIAGYFLSTVNFGGSTLTSAGSYDIFVAKFDPTGNHIWSKRFGDTSAQMAYGVAVDPQGNVILIGYFSSTVDFGGGVLTSAGNYDIFVAKLDGGGGHVWSQRFGDTDSQLGMQVTADVSGNVVATGYYYGSVDFGGGALPSGGLEDAFVAKFTSAGAHVWSKRFGDASSQYGYDVAADSDGNVVATGYFAGNADFGGGTLTAGGYDIYLAKYDPAGTHLWSKRFGDSSGQFAYSVTCDFLKNVILGGYFYGTVDFGGGALPTAGNSDFYVARFDAGGNHVWSQRFGGTGDQYSEALAVDGLGNAVVSGYFSGSMDLGGGTLASAGSNDIFVAKFWRTAPVIHSVRDVPGDQGGFVNLAWEASGADTPGEHVITKYTLWRAIDALLAAAMMGQTSAAGDPFVRVETSGSTSYYWYLVGSVDAYYLPGYSAPVPTLFDSTEVSEEYHYFQVIAHTSTPYVFYTSDPDSGYSIDNLAPAPPAGLAATQSVTPVGLALKWRRNHEADLSQYAVYRGTTPDFVPGSGSLLGEVADTTLFDDGWRWDGGYYYKVSAFDVHGNESLFALLAPDDVTGVGGTPAPALSYLKQNTPNPFAGATQISFGLQEASEVSLVVYDVTGRLVRLLARGHRTANRYELEWDGRDQYDKPVASGVYFLSLQAGTFSQTRKMVVAR